MENNIESARDERKRKRDDKRRIGKDNETERGLWYWVSHK